MKRFVFTYNKGWNEKITEVAEYDYDVSEEEVQSDFEEWVWGQIGEKFSWHEE